jgi:subtilisin family serine protease
MATQRFVKRRALRLETLEPRTCLAAGVDLDCATIETLFQRDSLTGSRWTQLTFTEAATGFRASDAGSTFGSALDLGQLSGSRQLAGSVGGRDTSDVMRFTLAGDTSVSIGLSGLRGDIDLFLYNSGGQRIAISDRGGASSESISASLTAGVYYIVVAPWRRASSSYLLSTSATPVEPPTPPGPDPPTPTSPVAPFADVAYYGGSNEWNLNSINAPEAWAQGYTGEGAVVAVVDTGVDLNHPDLVNQFWVNIDEIAGNGLDDDHNGFVDDVRGWDFAGGDDTPDDGNGHGTHVAGTIAAQRNGFGATGVAPDATIMPVRVLGDNGSGTAQAVAAGIRYAAQNGADIINLSLGGALSTVIQSAIQFAQQLNVLVVAAAGNEYASTPGYPARFSATLSNVLSVGAHSSSNQIAAFSNDVGASGAVQVDAPGVGVYSTYAPDRYGTLSGTSMATPHVAGLAALALSANQNLTASALRTLIVNGANRVIGGSDARGGINAALSVALAAAGQVSASAMSASAQSASTGQAISLRRFALASATAGGVLPFVPAPSARDASPVPVLHHVALSARHDSLLAARDRAIVDAYSANELADHRFAAASRAEPDEWSDLRIRERPGDDFGQRAADEFFSLDWDLEPA